MKKLKILSEIGYYSGFGIGVYSLYKTYIANKDLPAGVCPVENYRWMMYLAIVILLSSVLLQSYLNRKGKINKNSNGDAND